MPAIKTFVPSTTALSPGTAAPEARRSLEEILAPLHAEASVSSSLVASRYPFEMKGEAADLSKFLLLGQRGGGQPIRLGIFAGFEPASYEIVEILSHLLLQLRVSPSLSRDFALIAYPVVNVAGFQPQRASLAEFETRFARESAEADIHFFKTELNMWRFDGLLSLRSDASAKGVHATVRSEIIARDVVEPALAAAALALPLATQAVKVRPSDRYARAADYAHGRLSPPADVRPYPFEIELFVPRGPVTESLLDGLFVAFTEILRHYRALIAHGQDL